MTGAETPALVVTECRFGCRTNERQPSDLRRSVTGDSRKTVRPARRRETTSARVVMARINETSNSDIPQGIGGQRVRQMAEGHRRHVRMQALSCGERGYQCRDRWIDPELF